MKELELQSSYLDEAVKTIYFGGGTPSLLTSDEINSIIDSIHGNYNVINTPEITLEANPDDITAEKIKQIRQTPVTRVSIGVQSFYYQDLKYLNRVHTEGLSEYAIKSLQDSGYSNLSIDLIYGIPSLGMEHWKENLYKTIDYCVPHISAYALTVEPNTNLEVLIRKNKLPPVSEAETINHFKYMMGFLKEKNYVHYEISNFCAPGYESLHNSSYWNGTPYLGIGPSAHSFNKISRQWNCSSIEKYIESIENAQIPFESETLTPEQLYNEYIMTALRTNKGINGHFVSANFGMVYSEYLNLALKRFENTGWLDFSANICLTDEGKLFADTITAHLFFSA